MTPEELPPDWREFYEERAAIIEYMGLRSREVAEEQAMKETIAAMEKSDET